MASPKRESSKRPAARFADFDEYLRQKGIEAEVKAAVEKRVIALELETYRNKIKLSKAELARKVGTSRTQIDRVLDPRSQNVTLDTLHRVAKAMGKRIHVELID